MVAVMMNIMVVNADAQPAKHHAKDVEQLAKNHAEAADAELPPEADGGDLPPEADEVDSEELPVAADDAELPPEADEE